VFELLLTVYPRLFPRLTWGQRLAYAVRMTKYWIGPAVALHLFATVGVLIFAGEPARAAFHQYLLQITPLAVFDVLIRSVALATWRHPATPRTSLSRAVALVYATWPIYLLAWLMAALRLPLSFRPTPKNKDGKLNPLWLLPQITVLGLLAAGTLYTVVIGGHRPSVLLVFALMQGWLQLLLLSQWLRTDFEVTRKMARSLNTLKEITRPRAEVLKGIGSLTWVLPAKNGGKRNGAPAAGRDTAEWKAILTRRSVLFRMLENSLVRLGATSGSLLLFDEKGDLREATVAYEGNLTPMPPDSFAGLVQGGLAGWVLQNRAPALVSDTSADPRWLRRAWDEAGPARSALSVPLLAGERVSGVLTLAHARAGHFSEADLSALAELSANFALVL
jgi:hypothetical protein